MASHDQAVYSSLGFHHFGLHRHRRSGTNRRRFLQRAVGAAGLAVTSSLWLPSLSYAAESSPRPISGGFQPLGPGTELFHVYLGEGVENSTITDFDGVIGVAVVGGTGTGTNTRTGATSRLIFDGTDMRFMQGTYVGADGKQHQGSFGFV
ncbi:MAG TPA: twin-arginine translocation signal domain-containing protein [Chloroflexota bacterium]|nr:twin-arginine translocation signal domain-containing protein [Chloroflexota bacterium]